MVAIFLIFLQSFSISIYLIGFLELKIKRRQFFIICFILVLLTKISITNGDIFPNIDLRYIIFIVIGSLIYFCFYGSIQKKIFHYLFIVFLLLFQNNLLFIFSNYKNANLMKLTFILLFTLVSILAIILVRFLYYFRASNDIGLEEKEYYILSVTPFLSILLFFYFYHFDPIVFLIVNVCMMIINISVVALSNHLAEKNYVLQQQILTGVQNQYYKESLKSQKEVRIMRHDLKNLLLSLNYHIENRDFNQAKSLLLEITQGSDYLYKKYTECWPIDVVLSNKVNQMEKENILYCLDLKIPKDILLEEKVVDICAILGNILDNAIEEYIRIKSSGIIKICIHYHQNKLVFKITNPAQKKDLDFTKKIIKSEKKYSRYGLGINSVIERVNKLNGYSDFSWSNDYFKVLIIISIV
ncbi:GHKL domain-containing protein [Melissococcus plutonius]|uniref:GHKL domain-containing protein n=1 Tax=Melissococcus plutonius TaxID=33970 RepID=UPI0021E60A4D|nr:GHKL domain-containing protein [Melissococcus plutonius]MCV2498764.1 GHKL domain-containing protein [Melissococcus plutonius]MCV2501340.1 GHKL domain-containing protein [Melissococcus plutonius]MCV2504956.1 GHKL domain-containing protein [Melissococcus plutonius]MCV2507380.1 GHKL domain-containing protein [Melissococcus plutonius]MCV2519778.1 GHKL domain-containing protein [Melissococcus plutonius]